MKEVQELESAADRLANLSLHRPATTSSSGKRPFISSLEEPNPKKKQQLLPAETTPSPESLPPQNPSYLSSPGNLISLESKPSPGSSSAALPPNPNSLRRPVPDLLASPENPIPPGKSSARTLRRCISDLTTSPGTASNTNPSPTPAALMRCFSDPTRSPVLPRTEPKEPSAEKLKRMKGEMRRLIQWWEQILQEDDDEVCEGSVDDDDDGDDVDKEEREEKEAVRMERAGDDGLMIHCECSCSRGYQILFSDSDCYYKLM